MVSAILSPAIRRTVILVAVLWPASLPAHAVVDLRMRMRAPGHIMRGATFTYDLEVENPEYDFAYGVTMNATLPAAVSVRRVTAVGWNCSTSKQSVQCLAEELRPGRHGIAIEVTAPTAIGSIAVGGHRRRER